MVDQIKAKAQVENVESQYEVRGQEEIEQDSEDNFKEEDYTYVLDAWAEEVDFSVERRRKHHQRKMKDQNPMKWKN